MHSLVVVRDDRLDVRQVLADVGRALRAIVEEFLGWGHDARCKPRALPRYRPMDCGPSLPVFCAGTA